MKIIWKVDSVDIARVQAFLDHHKANHFVMARISTNLAADKPPISKDVFWERMVGCLLTTQQRSGPDSSVTKFLLTRPFPLNYTTCTGRNDLAKFALHTISGFGGLRRSTIIGKELATNMSFLNEEGGWEQTWQHVDAVRLNSSRDTERDAAAFIDEHFKGFGPKQSRNILQGLGISRYEIPIDSRITKWLNAFGFPVKLTSNALQDGSYYDFVSDGFQQLCAACDIMPCVLDAAIFSSFDEGKWTKENVVW